MNLSTIAPVQKVAVRTFHRGLLIAQKYSPQILTGVGIVGVVTSGVLASRATLKLEPVMADLRAEVDAAKELKSTKTADEYSSTQYKRDITGAYSRCALDLIKLYGPAFTTASLSIVCLVSAQGIMQKRNAALAALYKSSEEALTKYKQRVAEEFGEEKERDISAGVREVEETDDDGNKQVASYIDKHVKASQYARFFDETNPNWEKKADYNRLFLKNVQNHMNDLLHARGHVFLNDVYDRLGIDRTTEGAVVGWIMGGKGDNYIDFNIYDFQSEAKRAFVNGHEPSILLDFNVDGVIFEMI